MVCISIGAKLVMKLKRDKTQKLQLGWNSTQIVIKLKNLNGDKTPNTQMVTKLKNLNGDKTQKIKLLKKKSRSLWQN